MFGLNYRQVTFLIAFRECYADFHQEINHHDNGLSLAWPDWAVVIGQNQWCSQEFPGVSGGGGGVLGLGFSWGTKSFPLSILFQHYALYFSGGTGGLAFLQGGTRFPLSILLHIKHIFFCLGRGYWTFSLGGGGVAMPLVRTRLPLWNATRNVTEI